MTNSAITEGALNGYTGLTVAANWSPVASTATIDGITHTVYTIKNNSALASLAGAVTKTSSTPNTDQLGVTRKAQTTIGSVETAAKDDETPQNPADSEPEKSVEIGADDIINADAEKVIEIIGDATKLDLADNVTNANFTQFVTKIEESGVTGLTLDFANVTDVTEINLRDSTAFTTLNLEGNTSVQSVDIKNNTTITTLNLGSNSAVKNVDAQNSEALETVDVAGNENIETLNLNNSNVGELDVTGCTNLQDLDIGETQVEELDLTGCENLTDLNTNNSELKELSGLEDCKDTLETLDVSSCSLLYIELTGFSKLTNPALSGQMRSGINYSSSFTWLGFFGALLNYFTETIDYANRISIAQAQDENGNNISYSRTTNGISFNRKPSRFKYEFDTGLAKRIDVLPTTKVGGFWYQRTLHPCECLTDSPPNGRRPNHFLIFHFFTSADFTPARQ